MCLECGQPVDPQLAVWILPFKFVPSWVTHPDCLVGIYCGSDDLLDAYIRGYATFRPPTKNHRKA